MTTRTPVTDTTPPSSSFLHHVTGGRGSMNESTNRYVNNVWVRRVGTDVNSSLPVHVHPSQETVADILLVAHKLLFSSRDGVTASDLEFVTQKGTQVSNLDSLEMVAAMQKMQSGADGGSANDNTNNSNSSDGPVDVFLLVRRRQRGPMTAPLVDSIFRDISPSRHPAVTAASRRRSAAAAAASASASAATATNSPTSAAVTTPRSGTRHSNSARKNTATSSPPPHLQPQQTPTKQQRPRSPSSTTKTKKRPTTPRTTTASSPAVAGPGRNAAGDAVVTTNRHESTPAGRSSSTDNGGDHNGESAGQSGAGAGAGGNSPARGGGRPPCETFVPKWLHNDQCDNCSRPKRLHSADAIEWWANKQNPPPAASPKTPNQRQQYLLVRERMTPLWKASARKTTPKHAMADLNPLSCKQFAACWGREDFCSACHGPKNGHSRTALIEVRKHRDPTTRLWHSQRPLPTETLEERKQWRCIAPAKKCDAFVPLWNHNDYCAVCFCPEDAHAPEKRYFSSPGLLARPDYLTVQYRGVGGSSAAVRNWWVVNFPWRHMVVYLPLEDLMSLAQVERWLCVELRSLLRSALSIIGSTGVDAHHELRNESVRIASHMDACSPDLRILLGRALDALFYGVGASASTAPAAVEAAKVVASSSSPTNEESTSTTTAAAATDVTTTGESCEAIMKGGSVGSRSALLRKLSRAQKFPDVLPREVDTNLALIEDSFVPPTLTMMMEFPNPHYQTANALAVMRDVVKIVQRCKWQFQNVGRSKRYLSQDFYPL